METIPSHEHETLFQPAAHTRRQFMRGSLAIGASMVTSAAIGNSTFAELLAREDTIDMRRGGSDLVVQPVLTYDVPTRREASSWRNWGGVHTHEAAGQEAKRIVAELDELRKDAGFGIQCLPLVKATRPEQLEQLEDTKADAIALYPAGGWTNLLNPILALDRPVVVFMRRHSGPYYLWDEIIHARLMREHGDQLAHPKLEIQDVVVDEVGELLWRYKALYGLKNTLRRRIVCVGGPGGWATPQAPERARERFQLDMVTVPIPELNEMVEAGRKDAGLMDACRRSGQEYLDAKGVTLETTREAVTEAFLLQKLFHDLMAEHDAVAITTNQCMGSYARIMPCLTLGLINDAGWMAFCESDFVVIPSGILMHFISGKPSYLCNPTFPFNDRMMFAHCAAPRRMDGENLEAVDVVTHYESDHGAASHVHYRKGQLVTIVKPDFEAKHWLAFTANIVDTPELPTCRAQIEVDLNADTVDVARNLRGFHCMVAYGDHVREVAYAAGKVGITVQKLS